MHGHPAGDKSSRQRFIARSLWLTVPGTLLVIGALYRLVPPPYGLETLAERIGYTLRWLFVAMLPYAATCLTILVRRFLEGAHDPLARPACSSRSR
jgi:Na+-driven multidrug efflux pump